MGFVDVRKGSFIDARPTQETLSDILQTATVSRFDFAQFNRAYRYGRYYKERPLEATITVAANDARPEVKDMADFVCDGIGDQTEILAAISKLPTSGGTVKLSEGHFNLSTGIVITSNNITLEGCGNSTVIVMPGGFDAITVNGNYNTIRDLTIDGTNAINLRLVGCGVIVRNYYNSVTNCNIRCHAAPISLRTCFYAIVENNITYSNHLGWHDIHLDRVYNSIIKNNICIGNKIYAYSSNNDIIQGNIIIGSIGNGILMDIGNTSMLIDSNIIRDSLMNGIYLWGTGEGYIVINNLVAGCRGNGIYCVGRYQLISKNTILSPSRHGIEITQTYYPTGRHIITNNYCRGVPAGFYSIAITHGNQYDCIISNNIGDQPIYNVASRNTIIGNRVPSIISTAESIIMGNVVDYG